VGVLPSTNQEVLPFGLVTNDFWPGKTEKFTVDWHEAVEGFSKARSRIGHTGGTVGTITKALTALVAL